MTKQEIDDLHDKIYYEMRSDESEGAEDAWMDGRSVAHWAIDLAIKRTLEAVNG